MPAFWSFPVTHRNSYVQAHGVHAMVCRARRPAMVAPVHISTYTLLSIYGIVVQAPRYYPVLDTIPDNGCTLAIATPCWPPRSPVTP
jgi:hypothetical protein